MNKNLKQLSASQIEDAIAVLLKQILERDYRVKVDDINFASQGVLESNLLTERMILTLTISRGINFQDKNNSTDD
jgi:hypothetical protein